MRHPSRPPVTVITRYLVAEFQGVFLLAIGAFVGLYLVVDFFDRLSFFMKYDATAWSAARYTVFKVPLIITQMMPAAVLTAALVSLGSMARRNEILALRASGVSLSSLGLPVLVLSLTLSLGALAWNETVVPYSTRRSQEINLLEIRRQSPRTVLSDREIWYHGSDGFYNIDHIDRERETLYGVVLYRLDADFRLQSVVEVAQAQWAGDHWKLSDGVERQLGPNAEITISPAPDGAILGKETLGDFLEVYRDPDELSYNTLRQRIQNLATKGIDASRFLVDLHLKLAVPFMSLVLAGVAVPIAGRVRRHPSIALTVGAGILVGFAYWVALALGVSLGHSGALPPFAAAWMANAVFALAGLVLFMIAE